MDEMILDDVYLGGAAEAEEDHVLEVMQETDENPTAGEIDIMDAHSFETSGDMVYMM